MKLTDEEIIKKLAEALDSLREEALNDYNICDFCKADLTMVNSEHNIDCPVLLAEEVLKEKQCPNCEGTGEITINTWGSPVVLCEQCNGTGVKKCYLI